MDNFVFNQRLSNEIMFFNLVPKNIKKGKTLDPYLRELPAEQVKYICLNHYKTLSNLLQIITFVYASLTKTWIRMEAEKECYVADEEQTSPLLKMSIVFDQVIFFLGQDINLCLHIRHFNVLMSFFEDKKRAESVIKDNAAVFSEAENTLLGPKYEELVANFLSSKNKLKELFGSIRNQGLSKQGNRKQPFRIGPQFRTRGNRGEECSQLLFKPYNNNTIQEDKQGVRLYLIIAPSISSTELLFQSEFCKMHPLATNLFPVKVKELPSVGRVKHFVRN